MIKREDYLTAVSCRSKIEEITAQVRKSTDAAEIEEFTNDMKELKDREKELAEIEKRKQVAEGIATGTTPTTTVERGATMPQTTEKIYNADSPEYRTAWLKRMAKDMNEGTMLLGELTEVENRAYTMTTANTGAVVPTVTLDRIKDLLHHETPLLDDAVSQGMEQGFAIPVRTSITAGDAAAVAEGTANDDEQDEFKLVPMPGVDINKTATMTRRMKFMSIDAFEKWLTEDIAKRIGVAKEKVLIARLTGVAPKAGIAVNADVAIATENKLTNVDCDDKTIRKIMGQLDGSGQSVVYANRYTIYNKFAAIEDKSGKKMFIESAQVDPTIKGVMYGAVIKLDPQIPNDVAIFGTIGELDCNEFGPLEVFSTLEAKTANTIFTGAVTFDGGLENPKAYAHVTFKNA